MHESQDIEIATTALITDGPPDAKTRRYDRQLRLWAASGQSALEAARILVLSGSATGTSILKNLVLPGIGHFTILDHQLVTAADAGNNFFLDGPSSIGKSRAEETVRLLKELNEGVDGQADTRNLADVLVTDSGRSWLGSFRIIIAHNLEDESLHTLSNLTWKDERRPILVVVNEAGFLAEFGIQFHEHEIVEAHSDTLASLRVDKPFPALLAYAKSLDLRAVDATDHGHIPYVVILVRALEDWKLSHGGRPPATLQEKKEFKKQILALKIKPDEENFDEAHDQAYRAWTATTIPSSVATLFEHPALSSLDGPEMPPFYQLLTALKQFAAEPPYVLPLTSTLPDMKADTEQYIHLQNLYKEQANEEKVRFKNYLPNSSSISSFNDAAVDSFVKNAHAVQVLQGRLWGDIDRSPDELRDTLSIDPKAGCTHLALTALRSLRPKLQTIPTVEKPLVPGLTVDSLTTAALALLPAGADLPEEEWQNAVGELVRAPTSSLPTISAFLGGLVAQEVIKMVTKQYVPISGICVVDLVETWTAVIGSR